MSPTPGHPPRCSRTRSDRDLAGRLAAQQTGAGDGGPDRSLADRLEHDRSRADRVTVEVRQRTALEGREPHVRNRRAGEHGDDREQRARQSGATAAGERPRGRRRHPEHAGHSGEP